MHRSRLVKAAVLCALVALMICAGACRRKGGKRAASGDGAARGAAQAAKHKASAARQLRGARALPLRPVDKPPQTLSRIGNFVTVSPLDAGRGFAALSREKRVAAYHMARAAEAADRALYLQHHRDGALLKDLLETLMMAPGALEGPTRRAVARCLARTWLHHGQYDLARGSKRLCRGFDATALRAAVKRAADDGYDIPARTPIAVAGMLRKVEPMLFDARYAFRLVVDFYRGVTLAEARGFNAKNPHQALLAKGPKGLSEHPFRSGRGATPEGFYVNELHHAVKHLTRAKQLLEDDERGALEATIDLLQLADPAARRRLERLLLSKKATLLPLIGFFPTLRDPLDQRAIYAGGVALADVERTRELRAALRLGGALAARLPGNPTSKIWPRGRAVKLLYAAGALGPLSHGAALFVPGTPTFVLLDTPGPLLWRLEKASEGPLCSKRLAPLWVGLRQSLGLALARSVRGASKQLYRLPNDSRAQARADAAVLWLAEGDKTLHHHYGARCAEKLLPHYIAACSAIERPACAPVIAALRQAGALSEAQRLTERPRAKQALRALILDHAARPDAKRAAVKGAPAGNASATKAAAKKGASPSSQPSSRPVAAASASPWKVGATRGPIERRAYLSPVLIAVRETSGLVRDVQVRWARDWVAYNLARARAWRLQNGRPLKRIKARPGLPSRPGRVPGRVPFKLLRPATKAAKKK